MTLDGLVGKHKFQGISFDVLREHHYEDVDATVVHFILDDIVYTAYEDPDDGYRSMFSHIVESRENMENISNQFEVDVYCKFSDDEDEEVLYFFDENNNKPVFFLGTEMYDEYYPCFVAHFSPENFSINEE